MVIRRRGFRGEGKVVARDKKKETKNNSDAWHVCGVGCVAGTLNDTAKGYTVRVIVDPLIK